VVVAHAAAQSIEGGRHHNGAGLVDQAELAGGLVLRHVYGAEEPLDRLQRAEHGLQVAIWHGLQP
jgi:hypothetical protein